MDTSQPRMLSLHTVMYMIHHVFLPPQLPQQDDFNRVDETALLDMVIGSLIEFREHMAGDGRDTTDLVLGAMQKAKTIRDDDSMDSDVNVQRLERALDLVGEAGCTVPVHVRAQNAGVLVSRVQGNVVVEIFELSPINEAVITSKGRLRRCFPGSAWSINFSTFMQNGMTSMIADTLTKMSHQSAEGTKPRVKKARQMHDEDRDTVHPKLVTELFGSILRAVGNQADVLCLSKNTREEVLWSDSLLPWRRSPFWLLLRVTMQLMFNRQSAETKSTLDLYKLFMAFLMGRILDVACSYTLSSDLLHAASAKIARRLLKLNMTSTMPGYQHLTDVLRRSTSVIDKRWSDIRSQAMPEYDMSSLSGFKIEDGIEHDIPRLNDYIAGIATWKTKSRSTDYEPIDGLVHHVGQELPVLRNLSGDYLGHNLVVLESWVALNLQTWLTAHKASTDTCGRLRALMSQYYEVAQCEYAGDPEAVSNMLLTLLELWIGCDESATSLCPLLQDYDPGFPLELLQCLLLPSKSQMDRLFRAEHYLNKRRQYAPIKDGSIFRDFGTPTCFSVKFFQQSASHQKLLQQIEQKAEKEKADKIIEFNRDQALYNELMCLYDQGFCEYDWVFNSYHGTNEQCHSNECTRCLHRSRAASLEIMIHEWPLPQSSLEAYSTVFELDVPNHLGNWRDASVFVICDVFQSGYENKRSPTDVYQLHTYDGLRTFHRPFSSNQRISLLSETKPHGVTHRRYRKIGTSRVEDVCLNNGLRYQYFDGETHTFVENFQREDTISGVCTYKMPARSASLQVFLSRPPTSPSGPPPNLVLARQSICPDHLSLVECHQLASIPLGYHLIWMNVLRELAMPSVDLKKEETGVMILQAVHQAGPPADKNAHRKIHRGVCDEMFAHALLCELDRGLCRITGNWESSLALSVLITLTLRLLSLTSADSVKDKCLDFLSRARQVAFAWLNTIRHRGPETVDDHQKTQSLSKAIEIALICADTFNVDLLGLQGILGQQSSASIYIQCCMVIQEAVFTLPKHAGGMVMRLLRRWTRLTYCAYPILTSAARNDKSSFMDEALVNWWAAYQPCGSWRPLPKNLDYWLVQRVVPQGAADVSTVHYNLVTGELLVDGLPLSRLPASYEKHDTYQLLFGRTVLEVMPSLLPGMQFSARKLYAGHLLDFGFDPAHNDLRILATAGSQRCALVPRDVLRGHFPVAFIDDFVHWYDVEVKCLEFRPIQNPWKSSANLWRLVRHCNQWQLKKDNTVLISLQSKIGHNLSSYLSSLENHEWIHSTYNRSSSVIEIDVPRLRLGFYIDSRQQLIQSRQLRDMAIDMSQRVDTLLGFTDKLVLKHIDSGNRVLIVPQGELRHDKKGDHVQVFVDKGSGTKFHVYQVDNLLGRLVDRGSLQSKLYLCYLHALTSYCVPDPLTSRTGTEQAISILESAAVLSHDRLSDENAELLEKIAGLTPGRQYYPRDHRVMQQVRWDKSIGFFAQHGRLYDCVRSLSRRVERSNIFYPDSKSKLPRLDHADLHLLERDTIRNAMFWRVGSGGEAYSTKHDTSYVSRDTGQNSDAATRAFIISSLIHRGGTTRHKRPAADIERHIWKFLSSPARIFGPKPPLPPWKLHYDAAWLTDWANSVAQYWCYLHGILSAPSSNERPSWMAWFSTMAFAPNCDMEILQVLTLTLFNRRMAQIQAPLVASFDSLGETSFTASRVITTAQPALLPLHNCPEADLVRLPHEANRAFTNRQELQHRISQEKVVDKFVAILQKQWPCSNPVVPDKDVFKTYLAVDKALAAVQPLFERWMNNCHLQRYINRVAQALHGHVVEPVVVFPIQQPVASSHIKSTRCHVTVRDVFASAHAPPLKVLPQIHDVVLHRSMNQPRLRLTGLIHQLNAGWSSQYEIDYVNDLQESLYSLQQRGSGAWYTHGGKTSFNQHRQLCQEVVQAMYESIRVSWKVASDVLATHTFTGQMPQLSPVVLLEQLARSSWDQLSTAWKRSLVDYALALTKLQQAERLLSVQNDQSELEKELANVGHQNWDPMKYPESLLLEVESNVLIRVIQEQVAKQMRTPQPAQNAVMQLNMGEGKSSVLVPSIAAALADGTRLVRVIVTRAQSKQMFNTLTTKLGGLLARPVYRIPFSRDLRFGTAEAAIVEDLCRECIATGGVLLVQPEHVLSFRLMVSEYLMLNKDTTGRALLRIQRMFDEFARDIIDESDENFSVKFELIYTVGLQQSIEMSPTRWTIIQQVLDVVKEIAPSICTQFPQSIEVRGDKPGTFPRIRVLRNDAWQAMSCEVVRHICGTGLHGFPIARQRPEIRHAALRYITGVEISSDDIAMIENTRTCSLWTKSFRSTLVLLRGLFNGGVLFFTLSQKRWRVDYGLTATRTPPTQLAIPYRAKDSPSVRSEFSHPDVIIVLTLLSHYYGGLQDESMFTAIDHLLRSDQAVLEYEEWVRDSPDLSSSFQDLDGINLRDHGQCIDKVFPALRRSKKVVDYFLANIVFPKQMRTFPYKLSASGWDIGEIRGHSTTGFSGTNDSRKLLPLSVDYIDLSEQKHTNALVLEYLLQPENSVTLMPSHIESCGSDAERLLTLVFALRPAVRVMLDVGAQILELGNLAMAQRWLGMHTDDIQTQAAVFFDESDELCVVDRRGCIEALHTSTFVDRLDRCLVYLDEAHTRGTDLKLPQDYRAAVTLGPNMTKDKLVQACMRMRKLGQGQSVVFCVPEEIQLKMLDQGLSINLLGLLHWAILETRRDLRKSMALWAVQGARFAKQSTRWETLRKGDESFSLREVAEGLLEPESQSLEQRYRPLQVVETDRTVGCGRRDEGSLDPIQERCNEFDCIPSNIASLEEEQERELSPESEQEREVQRPAPAEPMQHLLHPDLIRFVTTGHMVNDSNAWQPAFETLQKSSAARVLDVTQFSHQLLATHDFARTIQLGNERDTTDDYQRPVQWVLTRACSSTPASSHTIDRLLIISPYEAQKLFAHICESEIVTLHLYAARSNPRCRPLDNLDLYTVGGRSSTHTVCSRLKILLNLFAGQLYFRSFQEYTMTCEFLGLAWTTSADKNIAADGFIIPDTDDNGNRGFKTSPVAFLRVLMTKIRRKCGTIDKTHMGRLLDGGLLRPSDFEEHDN